MSSNIVFCISKSNEKRELIFEKGEKRKSKLDGIYGWGLSACQVTVELAFDKSFDVLKLSRFIFELVGNKSLL